MLKQVAVEYKRLPVYDLVNLCNLKPEIIGVITGKDFIYDYPLLTFQFKSGNKYFFFNNRIYQETPNVYGTVRVVATSKPLVEIKSEFDSKLRSSGLNFSYYDNQLYITTEDKYKMYSYTDYTNTHFSEYTSELEFLYHVLTLTKNFTPFTSIQHMQYYFQKGIPDDDIYLLSPFISNQFLLTNPLFLTNSTISVGSAKEYKHHSSSFIFKPQEGKLYLNQLKDISLVKHFIPVDNLGKSVFLQPQIEYCPVDTDPRPIKNYLQLKNNFNNLSYSVRNNILTGKYLTENDPNYAVGTIEEFKNSYILKIMQYINGLDDNKLSEVESLLYPTFQNNTWLGCLKEVDSYYTLTETYNKIMSIISKVNMPYSFVKDNLPTAEKILDKRCLLSILDVLITFDKCIDSLNTKELEVLMLDLELILKVGKYCNKIPETKQLVEDDHYTYKGKELTYKALNKVIKEVDDKKLSIPSKPLEGLSEAELEVVMDELKIYDRLSVNVARYLLDKNIDVYKVGHYYRAKIVDCMTGCIFSLSDLYVDENNYLTFSNIELLPTADDTISRNAIKEAYIDVGKHLVEERHLAGILQRDDNSDIKICSMAVPEITQTVEVGGIEYLINASIDVDDVNLADYHQSINYLN